MPTIRPRRERQFQKGGEQQAGDTTAFGFEIGSKIVVSKRSAIRSARFPAEFLNQEKVE